VVEVTGDWRKSGNEEFHHSYTSSNIIRMIKSRRMTWVRHVERIFWYGNVTERGDLED
jgi:hypothetical protein